MDSFIILRSLNVSDQTVVWLGAQTKQVSPSHFCSQCALVLAILRMASSNLSRPCLPRRFVFGQIRTLGRNCKHLFATRFSTTSSLLCPVKQASLELLVAIMLIGFAVMTGIMQNNPKFGTSRCSPPALCLIFTHIFDFAPLAPF